MNFERKSKILEMLKSNGIVMLKDLRKLFPEVSEMTLRRDIEYFESIGEAVRIKGGARSLHFNSEELEPVFAKRIAQNSAAKEKIGKIAARFIESGRSMFFDAGSTMFYFTKNLPHGVFSIITSGPHVAVEASKIPGAHVTLLGGGYNRDSQSVSGKSSVDFIKKIKTDIAFVSTSAMSVDGCTQGNLPESELKKQVMQQSAKRIVLVDSSKFDKNMPFCFASLCDIDVIITDKKPSDDFLGEAAKNNIQVIWD